MQHLRYHRLLIVLGAIFWSAHLFADVNMVRTDYYRLSIDGELQGENYAARHTATEAALNAWLRCSSCIVLIHQPQIRIEGSHTNVCPETQEPECPDTTIPVDPEQPIEPATPGTDPVGSGDPVEPPEEPVEPVEDEPVPVAVYSYALDENGDLISPIPLDGAQLLAQEIHIKWIGGEFTTARNWCCKNTDHEAGPVIDGQQFTLNLADLPVRETPFELYADVFTSRTDYIPNNFARYTVTHPVIEPLDLTLEWSIPTERENGTALTPAELAGYNIEYRNCGSSVWVYSWAEGGSTVTYDMSLTAGCYDFRVSAADTGGLISEWSAVVRTEQG